MSAKSVSKVYKSIIFLKIDPDSDPGSKKSVKIMEELTKNR